MIAKERLPIARPLIRTCPVCLFLLLGFGCAGSGGSQGPVLGGVPLDATVAGDWDDVTAAAEVAASAAEAVILSSSEPRPGVIRFELVTILDEPGFLEVSRQDGELHIRCSIGRFGAPERESQLIEVFRRRLGRLHGVEWAPVRSGG